MMWASSKGADDGIDRVLLLARTLLVVLEQSFGGSIPSQPDVA